MQSNDPGHFFQTQDALHEAARREAKSSNKNGRPIKLASKALDVIADPLTVAREWDSSLGASDPDRRCVLVAESGGRVTRVHLKSGRVVTKFVGPNAPLTSLAVSRSRSGMPEMLYAGCWDKKIYAWPLRESDIPPSDRLPSSRRERKRSDASKTDYNVKADVNGPAKPVSVKPALTFEGHRDFVKAIKVIQFGEGREYLLSGGADTDLHIHNLQSGKEIPINAGHVRGIQTLAIDPIGSEIRPDDLENSFYILFSGDSRMDILRWKVWANGKVEMLTATGDVNKTVETMDPLVRHETGVFKIRFDEDGDVWTASADKTAKCLSREDEFKQIVSLEHGQFVQDLLVDDGRGLVYVACDDEDVWVWNKGSETVHHKFVGHFGQVSALTLVGNNLLVSGSLDCTIRQWSLARSDLEAAVKEAAGGLPSPPLEKDIKRPNESPSNMASGVGTQRKEFAFTAEEEAELAELMSDDE